MINPSQTSNSPSSDFRNYVLEQSSDMIIILDKNCVLTYFNPSAQKFTYEFRKIKLEIGMVFPLQGEKELWQNIFDRVLKGESIEFKKSDIINGERRNYIVITYPLKNEKAKIIGLCVQVKNIDTKIISPKNILANENLFKTLFDTSPIGIIIRDFATQDIVAFNDQICEMFGYSRDEFPEQNRADLVYSEDVKAISKKMELLKKGEIKNFQISKKYKRKDGSIYWGLATRSMFVSDNVTYMLGQIERIDQQKKFEEKLINNEAKIKAIFNSTIDKIFAVDLDYNLIDANESAYKSILFFLPKDAQKHHSEKENLNLRKLEYFVPHFDRAFKGEQYSFETIFYNIEDQENIDLITVSPIKNTTGKIVGASIYGKDISEIKKYQKELTKTTNQLKEAEELARLGSWELDVVTNILTWSDSVIELYKLPPEVKKVHVKQFYRLVHPKDIQAMKDAIQKTIKEGVPYDLISRRINIDGKIIYAHGKGIPHFEDGKVVKVFGTIQDITKESQIKEALITNQARLKKAQRISKFGYWEYDIINNKFTWSEETFNIHEWPIGIEPNRKEFLKMHHPDDSKRMKNTVLNCIKNKTPFEIKTRRITKKGNLIYTKSIGEPIIENGKVVKILGSIQDISKESKIENALIESEAKIRAIFNSTDDKVFAIDKEYKLLDFNDSAAKKLPRLFEKEKLLIGDVMLAQKPSLRKLWIDHYNLTLKGKKQILEKKYQEDGIDKTDLVTITPIQNKNGEIIGAAIYGREITDLQKAEKEVKDTQVKLKDAQDLGKIGNWKYDAVAQKITWSDSILKMFEYDNTDKRPSLQECIELVHPVDLSQMMEAIYASIKKGVPYDKEVRMFTKSGKDIYTRGKGIATLDKKKQLISFEGTLQDITQVKKIEENIQTSNQRYRELFENMLDGIIITNHEGKMVDANPAAEKLLGYSKEELGQLSIKDIVHPDDQEKSKKYLNLLLQQGFYTNYNGQIIHKDGTPRDIQVSSNAIYKNGKIVGSRDIVRDVSQIREAEKRKEQLNKELAKVNKELSDFAHIVSHDLKAPLRAIKAISNWLSEDYGSQLDQEGQKQLELLGNRVHRMHEFIEGIFEYTKMGRIKESKELVEFMEVIHNVTLMLNLNENVEIKIKNKLPEVFCEKIKIEQIFQNLISNAIKYNDKKVCKIEIDYEDLDTHFLFKVKDNGKGIEQKNYKRIFQIFQTLQSKDDFESTGIGLSIVKRIVQLHGGEINVKSEYGKWTIFEFTLEK